jgi:hypothetical protein
VANLLAAVNRKEANQVAVTGEFESVLALALVVNHSEESNPAQASKQHADWSQEKTTKRSALVKEQTAAQLAPGVVAVVGYVVATVQPFRAVAIAVA